MTFTRESCRLGSRRRNDEQDDALCERRPIEVNGGALYRTYSADAAGPRPG